MPVIDMSIKDLEKYKGVSPCPKDIDSFWENALDEMKSIDPDVVIQPALFQSPVAQCYDMWFTGIGGSRIYCKMVKPLINKPKYPAVIKFHGYTMNSGDWTDHLAYAAAGFVVVAMDCRGQGGLSEDLGGSKGNTLFGHIVKGVDVSPESLYYRNVFCDTAQIAGIVMDMPDVDAEKVIATGGSQGGALTLACAALEPRIAKAISIYPFLSDYKRVWDMDMDVKAYIGIRDYLRRFDPRHEKIDDFFNRLGYIDIQNIAKRIKGSVLMVTGLMDDICPPSTQFATYNKIESAKEVILYPDFGHEGLPGLSDIIYQQLMAYVK